MFDRALNAPLSVVDIFHLADLKTLQNTSLKNSQKSTCNESTLIVHLQDQALPWTHPVD